uniref:Uncharacterized protein n=1 Tax=Cacopsylla melanoneura TaxID=428564 RepID=A0A8D9F8F0_9HEMI
MGEMDHLKIKGVLFFIHDEAPEVQRRDNFGFIEKKGTILIWGLFLSHQTGLSRGARANSFPQGSQDACSFPALNYNPHLLELKLSMCKNNEVGIKPAPSGLTVRCSGH